MKEKNHHCLCCKSIDSDFLSPYKAKTDLLKGRDLLICKNCNFVFVNPMPTDEELRLYNSQYFQNAHGGFSNHPLTLGFHSSINKLRAMHVLDFAKAEDVSINKVFEIGPGSGMFLRHFKKMNPVFEYSIIESDLDIKKKLANEITHSYDSLQEVPKDYFDLIVCSHVLEHTNNPVEFINSLVSVCKIGGIIFIEVPCADYLFKPIHEPHLLFFNKDSISYLLNKFPLVNSKLSYHGPDVLESRSSKFFRDIFQLASEFLYKFKLGFLIKLIPLKEKRFLSLEELISIIPFGGLPEKVKASWWLRAISVKQGAIEKR